MWCILMSIGLENYLLGQLDIGCLKAKVKLVIGSNLKLFVQLFSGVFREEKEKKNLFFFLERKIKCKLKP